jgi:flagellar hook protein FlgE
MSRALFTAVSGLRNHQVWLDVIGNNIANANTVGYKSSTVVFDDILGQTISSGVAPTASKGGVNPVQVGLGMTIGSIGQNFLQGSIQTTNRNTDMAIQGDGFFVLANGSDRTYSRAGSFSLDANGELVDTATGYKVQGANGDITVSLGSQSAATATTAAQFKGNLDFTAAEGSTFVATFNVLDSVGSSHVMTITFTKNFTAAAGRWDWAVTPSASDTSIAGLTTATGSVVFNGTGGVASGASQAIGVTYAAGAGVTSPQAITLDFGTATSSTPLTGVASPSTVTLASQNGVASGTLQNFAVGLDGTITAFYTNGRTATIDTVQIASFANSAGLVKIGTNQYREGAASGAAVVGNPSTGGRGTVVAGALEMSNVDLAQEFSSMIIAERGFQANARTISTANQMLEELVNLKR